MLLIITVLDVLESFSGLLYIRDLKQIIFANFQNNIVSRYGCRYIVVSSKSDRFMGTMVNYSSIILKGSVDTIVSHIKRTNRLCFTLVSRIYIFRWICLGVTYLMTNLVYHHLPLMVVEGVTIKSAISDCPESQIPFTSLCF